MAKKPVPVTEDEYKKDPENVQKIETPIPGFPDAEPLVTYVKVEYLDDLTDKPANGSIETAPILVPVLKEKEDYVYDDAGLPEKNDDGSEKVQVVKYWDFERRELDLSEASLKKLATALKPFAEKSRPVVVQARASAASKAPGAAGHDLAAIREWAGKAGHDVKPKGRIPNAIISAYYAATGKPNPEGQQTL